MFSTQHRGTAEANSLFNKPYCYEHKRDPNTGHTWPVCLVSLVCGGGTRSSSSRWGRKMVEAGEVWDWTAGGDGVMARAGWQMSRWFWGTKTCKKHQKITSNYQADLAFICVYNRGEQQFGDELRDQTWPTEGDRPGHGWNLMFTLGNSLAGKVY